MTDVEKVGKKRGPVAGTEEARRGGEAVRKKYGREFYSRIGKKGGDTVRREHGSEFYAEIGRKGGEQTKNRQGSEFYARIGRIGGQRNRARVQPDTTKSKRFARRSDLAVDTLSTRCDYCGRATIPQGRTGAIPPSPLFFMSPVTKCS